MPEAVRQTAGRHMTHQAAEITFSNGNHAEFSRQDGRDPPGLLFQLGLLPSGKGRPVMVVCGGAGELNGNGQARATALCGPAVAEAAQVAQAAVVDEEPTPG